MRKGNSIAQKAIARKAPAKPTKKVAKSAESMLPNPDGEVAAPLPSNSILFSKTNAQYGCFSNFSPHPVAMPIPISALETEFAKKSQTALNAKPSLNDENVVMMTFKTSEHYFQSVKFPFGCQAFYRCADAATAGATKKAGGDRSAPLRDDWNTYRHTAMLEVLRAKFSPSNGNGLYEVLMGTGDKQLVEHSIWDRYWGDGGNGKGQNHLGKTLMQVRSEYKANEEQSEPI